MILYLGDINHVLLLSILLQRVAHPGTPAPGTDQKGANERNSPAQHPRGYPERRRGPTPLLDDRSNSAADPAAYVAASPPRTAWIEKYGPAMT